ncbi:MAG: pyridoxamine 5'-phosphate oxidase family protein [Saprospiraceae bacterium]|nr:pyridoxamine 5'-phosphate oxidase family protein [Saprospiraceae bacterium]
MTLQSDRSTLKRLPSRGHYDRDTLYRFLDQEFLCHVAFCDQGRPVIIPTAYGRSGDNLFLHGSAKSRLMHHLAGGGEASIAVTRLEGIVLARSLFHSSMNYHSAVLFGRGSEVVDPEEKMEGLRVVTESIWRGRWDEARLPSDGEMQATRVIRFPIAEGSVKIRTGPAKDNAEDYDLDIWAGVIPVHLQYGTPVPDERLPEGIALPPSLAQHRRITGL